MTTNAEKIARVAQILDSSLPFENKLNSIRMLLRMDLSHPAGPNRQGRRYLDENPAPPRRPPDWKEPHA